MNNYTRRMVLPIDEVVWHINARNSSPNSTRRIQLHGFQVGVNSIRLRTFARDAGDLRCAHCSIEGQFFSVDSHREQLEYTHLNLYGITSGGKEVLMTCDHILARGLGGMDDLSNTQTLCEHCNSAKSRQESRVANEMRRELDILMKSKKIYDGPQTDVAKEILIKWTGRMNTPALYK